MAGMPELLRMDAVDVVATLKRGDVTPHELLDCLEARIAEVDPAVNAVPTCAFERAHDIAEIVLAKPVEERGSLAGLPVAIKDLADVAGVRTTYGSPIFADHVPQASDLFIDRLEADGGIAYAKTNTPEFGAGANTFNEVFGATLNPWNLTRSAAGSSGGSAVALATGMAWLAQGSDMGGSLRNPASFCGVVGMRPSVGRVASRPVSQMDQTLGVNGPMARTVEDLALFLDVLSGEDPADPLSLAKPATPFLIEARSGWKPRRVAYSPDLGITPVDPEVAALTRQAAEKLSAEGVVVEEAHPNLNEAHDCFQVLRAAQFAVGKAALLETHRDQLKPEVVWNIEKGLALTMDEIARAEKQRVAMARRALRFFDTYDLLLCPATIVPPFPVGDRYVAECAGHVFDNYVEWLAIAYAITLTFCPALSLPCGFTDEKLPVGLQIVAPPRAEGRLLAGAKFMEGLFGLRGLTPIDPVRVPVAA